jgi:hypothetical protein
MANHSNIKDSGLFFTIVPEKRQVVVPETHKIIGVVGDHMAEQLTFEIPKTIDGHDISGCARRYVAWKNAKGTTGSDALVELTDPPEDAKEGMLYFTWTVRDQLTEAKGQISFSLHFVDVVIGGGGVIYHWGTTDCKNCEILDCVVADFSPTSDDGTVWLFKDVRPSVYEEDLSGTVLYTLDEDLPLPVPGVSYALYYNGLYMATAKLDEDGALTFDFKVGSMGVNNAYGVWVLYFKPSAPSNAADNLKVSVCYQVDPNPVG